MALNWKGSPRLKLEIAGWVEEKIITEEQAAAVLHRPGPAQPFGRRRLALPHRRHRVLLHRPAGGKGLEKQLGFFPESATSRPLVTSTVMLAPDGEVRIKQVGVRER